MREVTSFPKRLVSELVEQRSVANRTNDTPPVLGADRVGSASALASSCTTHETLNLTELPEDRLTIGSPEAPSVQATCLRVEEVPSGKYWTSQAATNLKLAVFVTAGAISTWIAI